ncbi:hypothetical protein J2Z60_001822 [Lactobacillus colini]|uniref:IrrE N-terminal-like domain-containing protein n=1 Tax=Lactobacillus colini TaxID=1819254 RepID=A0ABS4MG13_9LACO|nr:ImmA/IrrE family metallo-endopeptidase [Lactobacillus colini]MBP2058634.1 hypothetical protein [Lactobacillus colini]
MDSKIKQMLKKHNLVPRYDDLDNEGYIIHTPDNYPDVILINQDATDEQIERVILHEIGHAINDSKVIGNYKNNYLTRLLCENNADDFMIKEKVKEYVALGNDVLSSNYVNLAQFLGTKNYHKVKLELSKYVKRELI